MKGTGEKQIPPAMNTTTIQIEVCVGGKIEDQEHNHGLQ